MRGLDMSSPDMTTAEMTRAEVEAALAGGARGPRGGFHGQAPFRARSVRSQPIRRELPRGAAQPREPFACQARRGDAGPSLGSWRRSHRGEPRQGEPVCDPTGRRASRRRQSHGRARHRRLDRRASRRRSIRRRGLQRRRKEPVDGPHARDVQIRGSQPRGSFAGQSRAGGLAFRQAFRRQSRRRELARGGRKRRGSARRSSPRRRHVGPRCRFRAHRRARASRFSRRRSTSTAPTRSELDGAAAVAALRSGGSILCHLRGRSYDGSSAEYASCARRG